MVVTAGSALTPFHLEVPEADLDDLRDRLTRTRWPDELPDAGWTYGVPLAHVRELTHRWAEEFDWRAHEARLNARPQLVTEIDGECVHLVHVRSREPGALPLLATHGWPMSVFEYLDLVGPLTDPVAHGGRAEDAFHLVVPTIPGTTFSGPTHTPGWDSARVGRAWAVLMERLGYERYGVHGNDAGSQVSPEVGRHAPDRVVGVHVTQIFSFPSGAPGELDDLDAEDTAALEFLRAFTAGGGLAFNAYQSAQPQTVAYALHDSPVGLLAWLLQLFRDGVDSEYVLANASAYWLTGTAGSSVRRYFDEAHAERGPAAPTTTPTGVAVFPDDFQSVRRLAERDHAAIVRWTRMARGGHFAAQQAPDLLVEDIRSFFRPLRVA